MALLGTPASADTTYYYTGNPFTTVATATIQFPPYYYPVPNPNAEADAAVFGTNLSGFVTFDFDTSGVRKHNISLALRLSNSSGGPSRVI